MTPTTDQRRPPYPATLLLLILLGCSPLAAIPVAATLDQPDPHFAIPAPPGNDQDHPGDMMGGHVGFGYEANYATGTGFLTYQLDLAFSPTADDYLRYNPGDQYPGPGRFVATIYNRPTLIDEGAPGSGGLPGYVTAVYEAQKAWSFQMGKTASLTNPQELHHDVAQADYEGCCLHVSDGTIVRPNSGTLYMHASTEIYWSERPGTQTLQYGTSPFQMFNPIQTCPAGSCMIDIPNANAYNDQYFRHDSAAYTNLADLSSSTGASAALLWQNSADVASTASAHNYYPVVAAEPVYANLPTAAANSGPGWSEQLMGYASHAFMMEKRSDGMPSWQAPTSDQCDKKPTFPQARGEGGGFYDGEDIMAKVHVKAPTSAPSLITSDLQVSAVPRGNWIHSHREVWQRTETSYDSGDAFLVKIPWDTTYPGPAALVTNAYAPSPANAWTTDCVVHLQVEPNPGVQFVDCPTSTLVVPGNMTSDWTLPNTFLAHRIKDPQGQMIWEPDMDMGINTNDTTLHAPYGNVTLLQNQTKLKLAGPDDEVRAMSKLHFRNVVPGDYTINITVTNHLHQESGGLAVSTYCKLQISIDPVSTVAWVACKSSGATRVWHGRRFVPDTYGSLDLEFRPPVSWDFEKVGFEIMSISHNDDPVLAPDGRYTVWNVTGTEVTPGVLWKATLKALHGGPPVTGTYNVTIDGYNTANSALRDTCLVSIHVFIALGGHPGTCSCAHGRWVSWLSCRHSIGFIAGANVAANSDLVRFPGVQDLGSAVSKRGSCTKE